MFRQELSPEEITALTPVSLPGMLKMASDLSRPFPFVRVDLYELDARPLFGELTFTPHGCIHDYMSLAQQRYMGGKIEVNAIKEA
jgi:hypothetical protein